MKVVHIVWGLGLGGIETMLVNIANAQSQLGANVSVIIINDIVDDSLKKSFVSKVNLFFLNRKRSSKSFNFIISLNRILFKISPDVVHLHRCDIAKILFPKFRKKSCVTLHALPAGTIKSGNLIRLFYNKIQKKELPYSNVTNINKIPVVFSISNAVQKDLYESYNIPSTIVYNGIATKNFKEKDVLNVHKPLKVVMVSRLEHKIKGQDLLINAAKTLQGLITVDFIGTGSSMDYLKNLVNELGLKQYIKFLGRKDPKYIAEHLADYDLFVQPSRWEGFGLTVAEAMASRLPVLVSAGQGPSEVTCGDKYGWTFKNEDLSDLTSKIEFIINNYDTVCQKAITAQEYVCQQYDMSVTAKTYLSEYDKQIIRK